MHTDINAFGLDYTLWQDLMYYEAQALKEWGVMGWMGYNFGEHINNMIIEKDIQDVVSRLGNLELVATYADENEETNKYIVYRQNVTVEKICQEITESKYYKYTKMSEINTLAALESAYSDYFNNGSGHLVSLRTIEDQNEWESEQKRQKLELAAKMFAEENKLRMDSLEFIRALENEVASNQCQKDSWNSGEIRAEEWAAHQYTGGSESYFDDLNYVNDGFSNRSKELIDILEWLRGECPLLMAKYEEQKLAGKWNEAV